MQRRTYNRPAKKILWRLHPRPSWQLRWRVHLTAFLKNVLKKVTFVRSVLVILILTAFFYAYHELSHDILIIDPFSVPKKLDDAGLTPEVMAHRIGDRISQLEVRQLNDSSEAPILFMHDVESTPDVEIPGTKLGLKTVVEIARSVFGIYPKHISGDIVFLADAPMVAGASSTKNRAIVTVYVTQRWKSSPPLSDFVESDDVDALVQRAAESALEKVNPFSLAVYLEWHHEHERALEIVQRMIQDPPEDRQSKSKENLDKENAFNIWGILLYDEKKYDEAIAMYQKAINLDPKKAAGYYTRECSH